MVVFPVPTGGCWPRAAFVQRFCFFLAFFCAAIASAQPVKITANTTIGPTDSVITPTDGGPAVPLVSARIRVSDSAVLTMSGRHRIDNLELDGNSRLRHAPAHVFNTDTGIVNGLELHVSDAVLIHAGSGIDLTGLGYPSGQGPGRGEDAIEPDRRGGGGGYGGAGGRGATSSPVQRAYDGGLPYGLFDQPREFGSPGGSSSGGSTLGGAGGGSIRLVVGGELRVDGFIRCEGALASNGAGGSGGSVWLQAGAVVGTGTINVGGGFSYVPGGGGRIAIETGRLEMASNRIRGLPGYGAGVATVYIQVSGARPVLRFIDTIADDSPMYLVTPSSLDLSVRELRVEVIACRLTGDRVSIEAAEMLLDEGARIDVSGNGYGVGEGIGQGREGGPSFACGGGGHGGAGGARTSGRIGGGRPYGNFVHPSTFGSAGGAYVSGPTTTPGGRGGGAVQLSISGALTMEGEVVADGAFGGGNAGGGSGGSVWIEAESVTGNGTVRASGVLAGGGGRIALHASECSLPIENLRATCSLYANPGTVFAQINDQPPRLIITNFRPGGTGSGIAAWPIEIDLPHGIVELRDAGLIASSVAVRSANIIVSGATLSTASFGYQVGEGPGQGEDAPVGSFAGGGGHGGAGGTYPSGGRGGQSYGSAVQPTEPGSGGGVPRNPHPESHGGGGTVILDATNTISIQGNIRCDAGRPNVAGTAGGGGGSIWLSAHTIGGTGFLSANGFDTGLNSGGGGRIAIYSCAGSLPPANIQVNGPGSATDGTLIVAPIAVEVSPGSPTCFRGDLQLTARAGGAGTILYQWLRAGVPLRNGVQPSGSFISGSESPVLDVQNVSLEDTGLYTISVTNACGSALSNTVTASVCVADTDCDQDTDMSDVDAFFFGWDIASSTADLDNDGDTDSDDVIIFFAAWETGC